MKPAQLAMAYQACEVADLAATMVDVDDPVDAAAQAARVLAAARQLVAAAGRLASNDVPVDPLQRFAYDHPEEATEDIADWSRHRAAPTCRSCSPRRI
ncbi:hypothetical protein EV649_2068 [Kribbella sp. VKM Ac-2569]|uniref:hypothetical protein n=1 Tax=Kribbella sp. VKM Ac-2569 TaxID=2512220 RepID=UPI00102C11A2|nr:hypothetical protein [Kribbella sp. VKM Ac-2569]RZT28291.1 hypothetical protein EV649_2068 [Kribbella sp. VKM Ac-2569]